MDIDKIIAEVERLDREATRGWFARNDNGVWGNSPYVVNQHLLVFSLNPAYARDTARANVEMAALGRTAAPLLAAEVKRLRAGGCARDQRTTQFCAEAVAKDTEIAKLRDQILGYQQELHIAEQETARLKRTMIEPTEETGDPDSEHGAPVCVLCGRDIDVSAPFSTGPASGPAGRILGDDESAHGECLDHARQGVA